MMNTQRIIVVDDDRALVTAVSLRLRYAGYAVTTCVDSAEALHNARTICPDVLILDVDMPGYTGPDVQDELQSMQEIEGTPVIYITGDTSESTKNRCHELGAFAIVYKPFENDELLDVVDDAIRSRDEAA